MEWGSGGGGRARQFEFCALVHQLVAGPERTAGRHSPPAARRPSSLGLPGRPGRVGLEIEPGVMRADRDSRRYRVDDTEGWVNWELAVGSWQLAVVSCRLCSFLPLWRRD